MEHSSQNAFREEGGTSSRGYLFARSESMMSNSSAIVIEAEQIRQRYNRLLPEDTRDDEKDYKTVVHTLSLDRLCATLKSKVSEEGLCKLGPAGLKEEQARAYLEMHGKNQLTPPPKRNRWLALLKLTFLGIFNVLLWFCVIAQVSLIVIFSEEDTGKDVAKLANMTTRGSFEEDVEEIEGENEADYVTPIILAAVIVMAALLRWVAEEKAENQMEALQQIQDPEDVQAVRRTHDNNRLDVPLNPVYLVPGDIIFIEAGVRIPADVRILSCTEGMEVDNAAITGESKPIPRQAITEPPTMNVMDARNLAFFGTTVLKGTATCLVYATGDNTFIGKIAKSIKDADQNKAKSTLEVQIEHFIHIIGLVAIGVGALSFASNYLSPVHRTWVEILQNSSAALFAQVPEGLLPTVTISLMIAAEQMHRREVLVRKIDAIETLGCVSVLCSDKTGTLTKGEMEVQELVIPLKAGIQNGTEIVRRNKRFPTSDKEQKLENIAACGVLNNGAKISLKDGQEVVEGSPTEKAIFEGCAEVLGGNNAARALKARPENRLIFNIPFNSENKWMLTVHGGGGSPATLILKGAPDRVLALCSVKEDPDAMRGIERTMKELMSQARRVLCIAKKVLTPEELPANRKFEGTNSKDCNFVLEAFEFVGLYGIEDPPKQNVDTAVIRAQSAGVKVVMITGDHAETARAIASRINILNWHHHDHDLETEAFHDADFTVITGDMIESKMPSGGQDNFTDAEPHEVEEWWRKVVVSTRVFARVSPIHKQVIVQAYQKWGFGGIGDICAMTGDGVNDAPALKQAQVGVAMGIRGTAVAKDAADVVLVNDEFSNIVDGIEQGRLTSENLQKSIMYTLCSKVPQVAPTFAELFGVPQALTVAQVLLIDIGTDIWTAIAYALQAAESRLMELRPRHPVLVKLVNWKVLVYSYGYMGQLQMLFCWLMFFRAIPQVWDLYKTGKNPNQYTKAEAFTSMQGMTVYYWTLVLCQIAAAISTTTKVQSVFGLGGPKYGFPNKTLSAMFLAEILLGVFVIYVPWMQTCFETRWLPLSGLLTPLWALAGICFVEEVRKLIFRRAEEARHQPHDNALEPGEEGRTAKKRYHDPFAALKIGSCTCYCMLTERNSDY